MNLFNKLTEFAQQRVNKYGAQYKTFAIVGLINYPAAYIFEVFARRSHEGLWFRGVSTLLCIVLLLRNYWPEKLKKFLPLYWYCTLLIGIPSMASYMLLKNNLSFEWLMNANTGVLILILLVDSLAALFIEAIGIVIGVGVFYLLNDSVFCVSSQEELKIAIYLFVCIILFGTIFTRNKEIYAHTLLKAKDDLNEYLNQQIKARTLELEKALAFKTEFLNNMSHEVRTPVQGMCGISEGLVNNWSQLNEPKKFESAQLIAKSCRRLLSLVGNLLDLSKFDAGMMKLDLHPIDLNAAIDDMIEECTALYFQEKGTKFKFTHSKESTIIGDPERVAQVLRNLFFNAIKFSPKNSLITTKITKTETPSTDNKTIPALQISVTDEGIGVPEQDVEMIFGTFTQSSATQKKSGGTGLGLPICKQIVETHGGSIWVENNKDKGSTFHFIIPTTQPEYAPPPVRTAPRERQMNLLMIDDEQSCLASIEMMLMGTEYNLFKAETGAEGLQYLKDHPGGIDVVLLDLMMPDMYGYDVLQAIKQEPGLANIPVIMQSGTSDENEIKRCFDIGLTGYVKKPYQKKAVLAALDRFVQ